MAEQAAPRPTALRIWRCPCGAALSNPDAAYQHLNGDTICQQGILHRYSFDGLTVLRRTEGKGR